MSRLEKRFASFQAAGKKALIPYICAGDPSLGSTVPLLNSSGPGRARLSSACRFLTRWRTVR